MTDYALQLSDGSCQIFIWETHLKTITRQMKRAQGLWLQELVLRCACSSQSPRFDVTLCILSLLPLLRDGDSTSEEGKANKKTPLGQKTTLHFKLFSKMTKFLNVDLACPPPQPSSLRCVEEHLRSLHRRPFSPPLDLCNMPKGLQQSWCCQRGGGSWLKIWSKHEVLETYAHWKPLVCCLEIMLMNLPPFLP